MNGEYDGIWRHILKEEPYPSVEEARGGEEGGDSTENHATGILLSSTDATSREMAMDSRLKEID